MTSLKTFFATPVLYTPEMSPEEWEAEVKRMVVRSLATNDFIAGVISPDDYCDVLADCGFNPLLLEDEWAEGRTLLY